MPKTRTNHLCPAVLTLLLLLANLGVAQSRVWTCGCECLESPEWVPLGMAWPGTSPVVPYWLSSTLLANLPAAGQGDPAEALQFIHNGATMWSDHAGADFRFSYAGMTAVNAVADDGVNAVIFRPTSCPYAAGCLAACTLHASGGVIHGFDIEFFASANGSSTPLLWSALGPGVLRRDIWGFAAHEFGHALGLGHSAVSAATMAQNGAGYIQRSLDADDLAGAQALYGVRAAGSPGAIVQSVGLGCGSAGPPSLGCEVAPKLAGSGVPFPIWLVVAFPPPNPAVSAGVWASLGPPVSTDLGGGCSLQLNITGALGQTYFPWPGLLVHLPSDPLLVGIQATFQHVWTNVPTPLGLGLSNAITLTVGY